MHTEEVSGAVAAGEVVLALLGGVLGAGLLELLWRPRRVRRRVAALLSIEIAQNTAAVGIQNGMMEIDPGKLGPGFQLPTIVWDAAKDSVAELPEKELRLLVKLYAVYGDINRDAAAIDQMIDDFERVPKGQESRQRDRQQVLAAIGALRESIQVALKSGRELVSALRKLGSLDGDDPNIFPESEYTARAAKLLAMRTKAVATEMGQLSE